MNAKFKNLAWSLLLILVVNIALLGAILAVLDGANAEPVPSPVVRPLSAASIVEPELRVIVDDFVPQPYQGDSFYRFNRLGGDRGGLNDTLLEPGPGLLTATINTGQSWGGLWTSLNHPIGEKLPINFSAILPAQIRPAYQGQVTGVRVDVARGTPGLTFRLELKDRDGVLQWQKQSALAGGPQTVSADLPPLGDIKEFVWVLDGATAGDFAVVDSVSLTVTNPITDTATAAFVWSYGMLLNNWDPATGLVRDKARFPSGDFDAIQATGSLAAATALAAQLGVVDVDDARQIVGAISDTLLLDTPPFHGLLPHFVTISSPPTITIALGTEWSSVDTAIAAFGLLAGQSGLGLDTSGTETMLGAIDWADMVHTGPITGGISHGYAYNGHQLDSLWDVFGGETWLVELAYALQSGQATTLTYPTPPAANGSGFIDELAWLYILPPAVPDYWGNDWGTYRLAATYTQTNYYADNYPDDCFDQLDLFGLSAAEVPVPWSVPTGQIYQAFGAGGRFAGPNDGAWLLGAPVVTPHYSAMIAGLRPDEAIAMWQWLIDEGPFSPLNNVESLMFPGGSSCDTQEVAWNDLKGSWNLALQTLGWGNYLVQRSGRVPATWQTTMLNTSLKQGYDVLAPGGIKEAYLPLVESD